MASKEVAFQPVAEVKEDVKQPEPKPHQPGPGTEMSTGPFYGGAVSAPQPEFMQHRKTIGAVYDSQTHENVANDSSTGLSLAERIRDGFTSLAKATGVLTGATSSSDLPDNASVSQRIYQLWKRHADNHKPRPDGGCIKVQLFRAMELWDADACRCYRPQFYGSITLGNETTRTLLNDAFERNPTNPKWTYINTFYIQTRRHEELKNGNDNSTIDIALHRYNYIARDEDLGSVSIKVDSIYHDSFGVDRPRFYTIYKPNPAAPEAPIETGDLFMRLKYIFPLVIIVQRAELKDDVQLIGKQDPYVYLRYHGLLAQGDLAEKYTVEHDDGGRAPKWNQAITFNCADDGYLDPHGANAPFVVMEVWDKNVVKDKVICFTNLTFDRLMEVKLSGKSASAELYRGSFKAGGAEPAGTIWYEVIDRTEKE